MQTGVAARTAGDRRLEIVEDDLPWAALKEFQGVDQGPVELRLPLRETELDVDHPAVAEHGHEDRDPPRRLADRQAPAVPPIHLHGLARLVKHLLVHPPSGRTDRAQQAPHQTHAPAIALGALGDLLPHPHGRQVRVFGHQRLDLPTIAVQDAPARLGLSGGRLCHRQRLRHRLTAAVQTADNRPAAEAFDFVQTPNLGP